MRGHVSTVRKKQNNGRHGNVALATERHGGYSRGDVLDLLSEELLLALEEVAVEALVEFLSALDGKGI